MSSATSSESFSARGRGMSSVPPPAALPSFITPTLTTPLPPKLVPVPTVAAIAPTPPVLPSFNGNVPAATASRFTDSTNGIMLQQHPVTAGATASPVVISSAVQQPVGFSKPSSSGFPAAKSLPANVVASPKSVYADPKKDGAPPVTSQPKPPELGLNAENIASCDDEGTNNDGSNGWVGWLKGTVSNVGQKVAQKAKNSMDSMITTLDPQMKEFLHSGGDLDLVVASDKEVKVSPIREAFQQVFGKATVSGLAPDSSSAVAAQPVGIESGVSAAEQRINSVRGGGHMPHESLPVVAVENCIAELAPGCWYDIGVLLLDDPYHDLILQTFTQPTIIPSEWVEEARAATSSDYPSRSSGIAITIGQVAAARLKCDHRSWHESWCGVPRREMLLLAARSLATLYRARLPQQ